MKEKSKEFRELYLRTLQFLYVALLEKEDIRNKSSEYPIIGILERKIEFLESL